MKERKRVRIKLKRKWEQNKKYSKIENMKEKLNVNEKMKEKL